MNQHEGSHAVRKEACPKCRESGSDTSGNNKVIFSDGHAFCFACKTYYRADGSEPVVRHLKEEAKGWTPVRAGQCQELTDRRISEKVCRLYGYKVATSKTDGSEVHIANFYRDGELVAQHLRYPGKQFRWIGNTNGVPLFGQHLWKMGGRKLVITEGEIDCLSVAEMDEGRWPVVSLPMGAAGAVKAIKANYAFVSSYQEIVLCFDNDEAGKRAAQEVAEVLPPGKVKIVTLPRKDASEHLVAGDRASLKTALWEAQAYRPDGVLHVREVDMEEAANGDVWEFPFDDLTQFLVGQRPGDMSMWTSGTGSGKSTIIRELVNHHLNQGRAVGMVMLEESPKETTEDMISLLISKPVRKIKAARKLAEMRQKMGKAPLDMGVNDDLSDSEYEEAKTKLASQELYIYNHYGSTDYDNLIARVEYMAVALGVKVVVLDHVTAAVAGMLGDEMNSERLLIDKFMKDLRNLIERTGIHLDLVSQLKKSDGKGWEEGEQITLHALRGSGSLGTVPNTIIALERNRQSPDPVAANTSVVRILKDRFTGKAGVAAALRYFPETGRTEQVPFLMNPDGTVSFSDFGEEVPTARPNIFEAETNAAQSAPTV